METVLSMAENTVINCIFSSGMIPDEGKRNQLRSGLGKAVLRRADRRDELGVYFGVNGEDDGI